MCMCVCVCVSIPVTSSALLCMSLTLHHLLSYVFIYRITHYLLHPSIPQHVSVLYHITSSLLFSGIFFNFSLSSQPHIISYLICLVLSYLIRTLQSTQLPALTRSLNSYSLQTVCTTPPTTPKGLQARSLSGPLSIGKVGVEGGGGGGYLDLRRVRQRRRSWNEGVSESGTGVGRDAERLRVASSPHSPPPHPHSPSPSPPSKTLSISRSRSRSISPV